MELFKYPKNKKICIVSNDAGGAEILKYFVYFSKLNNNKFNYILTGPAKKILKKKNNIYNYKKIINNSDFVITGTSYKSLTEYNCIKYCKKKKIKVFSILDHWVNYKKRFLRKKKFLIPDKIIVCDSEAIKMASKYFNNLIYMRNPYWRFIKSKFKYKKKKIEKKYLYVSSNFNRLKSKKFNDFFILKKLIKFSESQNKILNIYIKKHPSENENKYKNFILHKKKSKVLFSKNQNLFKFFEDRPIVCGHNSMALATAKICGLKTISISIPGKKNTIPNKYIDKYI